MPILPTKRRLLFWLASILAGNAIYFLLLAPRLPGWLLHQPFQLDAGLGLDFLICVAIYLALRPLEAWDRRRTP